MAHFISPGILGPLHSFKRPWPIPLLHSHRLLLSLSSFLGPITISFTFGICWPLYQPPFTNSFLWAPSGHLCLLFTSYDSCGLTTSFFGAPLGPFDFFGVFLLFCGPVYHCSSHSSLIVFLTLLILFSSPFVILLGFFLPLAFIFFGQNGPQHHLTFNMIDV